MHFLGKSLGMRHKTSIFQLLPDRMVVYLPGIRPQRPKGPPSLEPLRWGAGSIMAYSGTSITGCALFFFRRRRQLPGWRFTGTFLSIIPPIRYESLGVCGSIFWDAPP
ncbi:hypothetical protein Cob_v004545 [Colletotrichum orbiculare MAFF 240422]|uniref:Uncharacterized protein n=1 Tax=Colletotrichum orbiculare (strain 104-T / ATCC 96160 / CBS 514.97 / LARS 414 / MAFF 240422) TaxID=1213857 RepID=A0A484FXG2_COLOR|nr:hypothetical protein Cob_v004545 [Colletotrichum orbiculare MAFF 240422]